MSRPIRAMAHTLSPFVVVALRKDMPLPARMLAIDILRVDIDAMLTTQKRYENEVKRQRQQITKFMETLGYQIENDSKQDVVEWFRNNTLKRENEDPITYADRTSMFLARVLAVGGIIIMDMSDVYDHLAPFTGGMGITGGEQ